MFFATLVSTLLLATTATSTPVESRAASGVCVLIEGPNGYVIDPYNRPACTCECQKSACRAVTVRIPYFFMRRCCIWSWLREYKANTDGGEERWCSGAGWMPQDSVARCEWRRQVQSDRGVWCLCWGSSLLNLPDIIYGMLIAYSLNTALVRPKSASLLVIQNGNVRPYRGNAWVAGANTRIMIKENRKSMASLLYCLNISNKENCIVSISAFISLAGE